MNPLVALAKDLTASALLGSRGGLTFPRLPPELEAQVEMPPGAGSEVDFLRLAAFVHATLQVGMPLPRAPAVQDAYEEEGTPLPEPPPSLMRALGRLLQPVEALPELRQVLPECLEHFRLRGYRLPPRYLVPLLDAASRDSDLRPHVLPVLGSRGEWVASYDDKYSWVKEKDASEELFEIGTLPERIASLQAIRRRSSREGREKLQAVFPSEPPESRGVLLAALLEGLSLEDEAFLEAALEDKRKEVRVRAVELLRRLPESALVRRMIDRTSNNIIINGQKVRVVLPSACDKALLRDGLEPKPKGGVGEKAWWLQQMMAGVPPNRWPGVLELGYDGLVAALSGTEFRLPLLEALAQSTARARDPASALALLRGWLLESRDVKEGVWGHETLVPPLVEAAGPYAVAELLASRLRSRKVGVQDNVVALVLTALPRPYTKELTHALLDDVRQVLRDKTNTLYVVLDLLRRELSWRVAVDVSASQRILTEAAEAGSLAETQVSRFVEVLEFRAGLEDESRVGQGTGQTASG